MGSERQRAGAQPPSNEVEAMGIEPTNLLHAMQALYQLSYAPGWGGSR